MHDKNDPARNRPTEKGRNNDPDLHDDSALQPGTDTISSSDTDENNEEVSKTGADGFRTGKDNDPYADPAFDEVKDKS